MHSERAQDFLGIPIDLLNQRDVLTRLVAWRDTGRCGCVSLVNAHSILACTRDAVLCSAILNCDLALPDGVSITLAARLLGYGRVCRLPGPSLMLNICDSGRVHGFRHFFYGGGKGVAERLAERLLIRFPGIQIAGLLSPPFRELAPEEDSTIVARINATSADLVWVGLGTGKQEKWMVGHAGRINAAALLGVGAAFDFHAGMVPWAPAWLRTAGCEWAYRTILEPRRLWHRNLDTAAFLVRVIAQRIGISAGRVVDSSAGSS